MNPNEILKAAQENNAGPGEAELEKSRNGLLYALMVGVALCVIMIVVEFIIFKKPDFGKPAILLSIASVSNMYEGARTGQKRMKVIGIVEAIFACICIIMYTGAFFV